MDFGKINLHNGHSSNNGRRNRIPITVCPPVFLYKYLPKRMHTRHDKNRKQRGGGAETMVFSVVIHQKEEGGYVGQCRELPEIVGTGATIDECCTNVRQAFIAYFQEHGMAAIESLSRQEEGSFRGHVGFFSLN